MEKGKTASVPMAGFGKAALFAGFLIGLAGAGAAQPGKGNLVISGRVLSMDGSPAAEARVVCTIKNRPNVLREVKADAQGKWAVPFIRAGTWVATAFADEQMSELQDVLLTASRQGVDLVLTRDASGIVIEAKKALYRDDLPKTIEILEWFVEYFPRSRERAGAIFWLAYSLNKLGQDEGSSWKAANLRTLAFKHLEALIADYPASEWRDDAEILRIDVALALYRLGQRRYRAVVEASVAISDPARNDVRLAGLGALMELDVERAVRELREIVLTDPDPAFRRGAVSVLGESGSNEGRAILADVAVKDHDASVKKEAQLWLDRGLPAKAGRRK